MRFLILIFYEIHQSNADDKNNPICYLNYLTPIRITIQDKSDRYKNSLNLIIEMALFVSTSDHNLLWIIENHLANIYKIANKNRKSQATVMSHSRLLFLDIFWINIYR